MKDYFMQPVHKQPQPDPDRDFEFKGINLHHYQTMCDMEKGTIYIKVQGEYHRFYPDPVRRYEHEDRTDFLYSIRTHHESK